MQAPVPCNETARLAALYQLQILDTATEPAFDALTELAVQICGGGKAALTLIDQHRQWFKSGCHFNAQQTDRADAFCAHAILTPNQVTDVPDARLDPRFADNPQVLVADGIRSYSGAPLQLSDNVAIGTLCVFDTKPRQLSPAQLKALQQLAAQAVHLMQCRLLQQQAQLQQQQMQKTRSRLQAVIDSSTEAAMIATDVDGVIQLFNTGAERMLGYLADEVIGKQTPAIFHDPNEVQRRGNQLTQEFSCSISGFEVFVYRARHGASETRQWTYITNTGQRKQVRLSVSAIRTEQGELEGFLGVANDISQLEQLNHALLLSEQRHRSMLENLPGVVYRCINDEHWTMLFISDEVEKLTGLAARSFIRNQQVSFASIQHPDDEATVRQIVEFELSRQARFTVEYRMRHADGSWRWVQELGRGIYDQQGELLYIDGFIWDVTTQKKVEQALRSGEQKLASLYELAPLAISLSRLDTAEILSVNPQWQQMTGSSGQLDNTTLPQLLMLDEATLQQRQEQLRQQARFGPLELALSQHNGNKLAVALSEVLFYDADDQPMVWSIMQDISERRRIEQMKNQFVSMVSHELRTPLTAISGSLGLLKGGVLGNLPEPMQPMLQIAAENAARLTQLINDLLDIDKLVAGKMQFSLQPVNVLPLLAECVRQNQPYADKFGNRILHSDGPDAQLLLDPMRFHQIMANLLSNAAKFSPAGAEIRVWTELRPSDQTGHQPNTASTMVRIFVQDQGPGIPLHFRDRIFDKFSQADAADARQRGGTGLGLAIVRELTLKMGGDISFYSEPGQGCCFYLDFPLQ